MTDSQRKTRARLETRFGRPDPKGTEKDVATLLSIVAPEPQELVLHTDEHQAYPRALKRVPHLSIDHQTISSRAARTPQNPLFPVNLLDLLIRHSGANHKRETIAHSKRRQGAIDRLWVFVVWRNWIKSFSEQKQDGSPAMRLGLADERMTDETLFEKRLFPHRIGLPERWTIHYRRLTPTRRIPRVATHRLKYAY